VTLLYLALRWLKAAITAIEEHCHVAKDTHIADDAGGASMLLPRRAYFAALFSRRRRQ